MIYQGKLSSRQLYRDFRKDLRLIGNGDKEKTEEEKQLPSIWSIYAKVFDLVRDHHMVIWILMLLRFYETAFSAVLPWAGKFMIDNVMVSGDYHLLYFSCGILAIFTLLDVSSALGFSLIMQRFMGGMSLKTKRLVMKHLTRLPISKLIDLKVGGLQTRLQNDTESLAMLVRQTIFMPFNAGLKWAFSVASLLYLSWKVTLVFFVCSSLMIMVAWFLFRVLRPLRRQIRADHAVVGGKVSEVLQCFPMVRIFGKDRRESLSYATTSHYIWRKDYYANCLTMITNNTMGLLQKMLQVSIWLFGGIQVFNGTMTIGEVMVFISFTNWFYQPILLIMNAFDGLQHSMAGTERTFELLDEEREVDGSHDIPEDKHHDRGIRLSGVKYHYPNGTQALDDLNLFIPKSKVTALVGPSGSGKTTTINILLRFFQPESGSIHYDDVDIQHFSLNAYRRKFSLVSQEIFLFDGTIFDNIAYGMAHIDREQVEEAARIAQCHGFISELEKGYGSIIGERGVRLSGGQKQRIALARAIASNPEILVLDEPTSHLDVESEYEIQNALGEVFKNRTVVVIAHRLSTIREADNIVYLDKGRVVEQGPHKDLLQQDGAYAKMVSLQASM